MPNPCPEWHKVSLGRADQIGPQAVLNSARQPDFLFNK
jgi:hypothetical protein